MRTTVLLVLWPSFLFAQQAQNFAGAAIGVTTLSADGKSAITSTDSSVSLYKPENGFTAHLVAGRHLTDYLSVQGNYTTSTNALTLTSLAVIGGTESVYEQVRTSRQQLFGGDAMLYFRNRASVFRPYLSMGGGANHFSSKAERVIVQKGGLTLPTTPLATTKPFLRVAVGIDARIAKGWYFRYIFSESILKNPISAQLTPPASRNLASFQSLFGFVKQF